MKSFRIRSTDTEGQPALTIVNIGEIDDDTVSIYQRIFFEHPVCKFLRTWKGRYYCERHVHLRYGTLRMLYDFVDIIHKMTDEEFERFIDEI